MSHSFGAADGPPVRRFHRAVADLPLFWKLLLPFLALVLAVGGVGAFLIVRNLSANAQTTLDQDLSRRSLEVRALLNARELYLLESVNFAANLQAMAPAIRAEDKPAVRRLLQSALALKRDLDLLVATDARGTAVTEFLDTADGTQRTGSGRDWRRLLPTLLDPIPADGAKGAVLLDVDGRHLLAVAAPVCSGVQSCSPVGLAVAGESVDDLLRLAGGSGSPGNEALRGGVALYDSAGARLVSTGLTDLEPIPAMTGNELARRRGVVGGESVATLYSPFDVQGRRLGTLAVTLPASPAFAAAREAGTGLALVLLGAMVGVVLVGAVLTKLILRQVAPLLRATSALGEGRLAARVDVVGADELGQLARGVNAMAEQLQASYETLEMRVDQRTAEVQRLLQERTEFFASLSHELRTPLAVILGQATVLRLGDRSSASGAVDAIDVSARQLLELVNHILDLARADAGRVQLTLTDLAVADVVADIRSTIDGLASAAQIAVSVDVAGDLPLVRADRARLREILVNLVDNAVKYTPSGGSVALRAAADEEAVTVTVSDTGVGIPEEFRPHLFQPFFRVPSSTPQRGAASTGLGLALTKRLVEAHGGTIEFEDADPGTVFRIRLPAAPHKGARRRRRPVAAAAR